MKVLTIGAKPSINLALAQSGGLRLVALSDAELGGQLPYESIAYVRRSKLSPLAVRQVRDAIRRHSPDVVHAFYPRPLAHAVLAAASLRSKVPIVSYRGITAVPKRWSPEQWFTYLSPRVAAHGCESMAVADALVASGVARERCHVVHNCLGTPPIALARDAARRELGIDRHAFVVMMVANMRRVKGADVLLKAAVACRDVPNAQFVLIGRVLDAELATLARHPALRDRIHLVGYRKNAAQLLGAADLFVMPSRAEALCVALLEAMATGVCPVVSDAGGMKEAVRHEIDGCVVPSGDIAALARAIRTLHDHPARRERLCHECPGAGSERFFA